MIICLKIGCRRVQPVAGLLVHRVEDLVGGVEADQVEQRERAHRQAAAELHRGVDVLAAGVARLVHADGVVEVAEQQRVGDEAGAVADGDRRSCRAAAANASTSSTTSGSVTTVRTTSTSFMTGAGLKKCMPTTLPGPPVRTAISVTDSDEVLVARMVSGRQIPSSSAKTAALSSRLLGHGLDDQVGVGEVGEARCRS